METIASLIKLHYTVTMFQHVADFFECLIKYLAVKYPIINC